MIEVDFSDVKDVLVISFSFYNRFSGCCEGSYHSNSMSILEDLLEETKEEGHYFELTPDQIYKVRRPCKWDMDRARETDLLKPDEALLDYLYKVEVEYQNCETFDTFILTINWFGNAPSGDETFRDLISERVKEISLFKHARSYNIDDDF